MFSKNNLPYFALLAASVIWGVTSPIMKIAIADIPLFSLAFIRFFYAAVILSLFVKNFSVERKDIFSFFCAGVTGISIVIFFFLLGIGKTTAINASILITTEAVFAVIFGWLFLKEHISRRMLIGILLSMIGIFVIFSKDLLYGGLNVSPIGDILITISSASFAIYQIFSKKLFVKYSPLTVTFYTFLIGSFTFFPFSVKEMIDNPAWVQAVPFSSWIGVGFGVLFSSTLAFSLWQWGLSRVEASHAGFFLYFSPIVAIAASWFLLGETVSALFALGAAFIFSGVFISQQHHHHPIIGKLRKKT